MTPVRSKLARSAAAFIFSLTASAPAQTVNTSQAVTLQGLRTSNGYGSFAAAAYATDGSLYLLYNQHDGIRLLHTDDSTTTLLAQTQIGAIGDIPIALALDPAGNLYVTGTTSSGQLTGTSYTPYPSRADTSTNSFLAKFDPNLNLLWLTFLGSGRTAATGLAITSDAAFVTGITFNATFPVSASAIQQSPAPGSSESGFVERFSSDGKTLVYATYLTGALGSTTPTAIAADSADNAYITGATTASGYPTIAALQPAILTNPSGFLTKLTPAADALTFSTFLSGTGLTSLALDASTSTLVLAGNLAPGQFPIATVSTPLTSATYQSLLRIPLNGQSITSSILLVPGTQSFATPGPNGTVWITGSLTTPLFPGTPAPDYTAGDTFLLHLTSTNTFDQTIRLGGIPINNSAYASLTTTPAAPAVSGNGQIAAIPNTLTAAVAPSLLATQRFDFPLAQSLTAALPNAFQDMLPTICSGQCTASAGLLTTVAATDTPSLTLSTDDLPNLTLRNQGFQTATGVILTATGYTLTSNCASTLAPSNQCSIVLTGSGPGTLTTSAANAATATATLAATTLTPDFLAFNTPELDFGIVTSSTSATETLTITNLTSTAQSFTATKDGGPATAPYTFTITSTDCTTSGTTFIIAANVSCHLNFALAISSNSANDGPIRQPWKISTRDILLTAFAEAAALNLSASKLDFGTQFTGSTAIRLPRYLYLSNNSSTVISHTAATLPTSSPFTVTDACPSTLEPHTVCQITFSYNSPIAPSNDDATLTLDDGLTILLSGTTLPPTAVKGLLLTPISHDFGPVPINSSSAPITFTLANLLTAPATVNVQSITTTGDFTVALNTTGGSSCIDTVAPTTSCFVQITFSPTATGDRTGTLTTTTSSGISTSTLTGYGESDPGLALNPTSLNFGTVNLGTSDTLTATISNTNAAPITFNSLTTTGDYSVAPGTCPTLGNSLAANATCTLSVTFTPSAIGSRSATLTLTSSDPTSPTTIPLTGTGLAAGSFTLTVNGATTATVTVTSGNPATYPLTLTPLNGFTGNVALTCTPITAAQYATCSLLDSTLTLNENTPQASTATVDTITSAARIGIAVIAWLLYTPLLLLTRRRLPHHRNRFLTAALILTAGISCLNLSACGGNSTATPSNLRYAPAGTYQYQVTAVSTTGTPTTSTVTLTVIVQ